MQNSNPWQPIQYRQEKNTTRNAKLCLPILSRPLNLSFQPGKYFLAFPCQASSKPESSSENRADEKVLVNHCLQHYFGSKAQKPMTCILSFRLCKACIVSTWPSELSFLVTECPCQLIKNSLVSHSQYKLQDLYATHLKFLTHNTTNTHL